MLHTQFSAELYDFVHEDLDRLYPRLAPLVRITILEAGKTLLRCFIISPVLCFSSLLMVARRMR